MEADSRTEEKIALPHEIAGWQVRRQKNRFGIEAFLVMVAVLLPLLAWSFYQSETQEFEKIRKEQAETAYSGFVIKFALLLAAGVSVRQCFYRLETEYSAVYEKGHCLALELKRTKQELEHGYSENAVYELFGRRMKYLPYQRMAGILGQNSVKGMQGIRELLLQEAREVMAEERTRIRMRGEQVSSKLLLPMMGLLLLVFGILLVPAFQTF